LIELEGILVLLTGQTAGRVSAKQINLAGENAGLRISPCRPCACGQPLGIRNAVGVRKGDVFAARRLQTEVARSIGASERFAEHDDEWKAPRDIGRRVRRAV